MTPEAQALKGWQVTNERVGERREMQLPVRGQTLRKDGGNEQGFPSDETTVSAAYTAHGSGRVPRPLHPHHLVPWQ